MTFHDFYLSMPYNSVRTRAAKIVKTMHGENTETAHIEEAEPIIFRAYYNTAISENKFLNSVPGFKISDLREEFLNPSQI